MTNKDIVLQAMTELFIRRDTGAVARFWGDPYTQHNPGMPDGTGMLAGAIASLGPDFKYEPGMIIGEGDLVMLHARCTGWGPKPMVVVDIFRLKDGKIVEHWDVMQDEVPAPATKSGHPMFTNPQK